MSDINDMKKAMLDLHDKTYTSSAIIKSLINHLTIKPEPTQEELNKAKAGLESWLL